MTGNVVVLGFAAAGAPGFSVTACLTSLGLFLVGAVCGGQVSNRIASRATGWARYTTIAILAFAMGIRNAVIRRLSIPDMTTTVLTMTLTGLAADSTLAGGSDPRTWSRAVSVLAMLAGAAAGAGLFLHQGAGPPLAIAAGTAAVTAAAACASPGVRGYLDRK